MPRKPASARTAEQTGQTEHADVVVVGSGFGGSVSAYRLAQAGLAVVVLERGNAYPPNSFPRTPAQMSRAFWNPAAGLYGMFDVWHFSGCDAVVSSGLGGGSLIYANVLLRKDEHWFVQDDPLPNGGYESWPVTRADLDPYYDEVERMLGATPYPLDSPGYAATPKTQALRDAAAELGLNWQLPPLAVSFAPRPGAAPGLGLPIVDPDYGNLHGRPRNTCRLCGECNIGCNEGAKNSLDYTYLSAAQHYGADLRPGHDVKAIRPRPSGGYEVDYVRHDPQTADSAAEPDAQPTRDHHLRPARAGRRHLRHLLPAAAQPALLPRPELGARSPVQRQRRHPELPGQREKPRPRPPARREPGSGDHDRDPAGRRA